MDPIEDLLQRLDTAPPSDDLDRGVADLFERRAAQARRRQRWTHGVALLATLALGLGLGYGWGYSAAPDPAPTEQVRSVTYILPVTASDGRALFDLTKPEDAWLSGTTTTTIETRPATNL